MLLCEDIGAKWSETRILRPNQTFSDFNVSNQDRNKKKILIFSHGGFNFNSVKYKQRFEGSAIVASHISLREMLIFACVYLLMSYTKSYDLPPCHLTLERHCFCFCCCIIHAFTSMQASIRQCRRGVCSLCGPSCL